MLCFFPLQAGPQLFRLAPHFSHHLPFGFGFPFCFAFTAPHIHSTLQPPLIYRLQSHLLQCLNLMANHQIVVEIFHSGSKWWTDRPTNRLTNITVLKSHTASMAKNRLGEAERILPLNKRGRGKGKESNNRT